MENSFFDPWLLVEIALSHLFKIDLTLTQDNFQISCLTCNPFVDELHGRASTLEQEVTLDVDTLHTLNNLIIQCQDFFLSVGSCHGCHHFLLEQAI
jgi:hypothetical protein